MNDLVRNNPIQKPTLSKSILCISPGRLSALTRPGVWVFFIGVFLISSICYAETAYPKNLWKGLIAEACGDGERGMTAVACVYRNRLAKGLPLGCVALKRKDLDAFVKRQGVAYELTAKKIIHELFINQSLDVTGGACYYENVGAYGKPSWSKGMIETCKIGSHTFWKERR